MTVFSILTTWPRRRWVTAIVGAAVTALALGLPTDVIANPVFGRQGTPVTWWSYLALGVTSVLSGVLLATYVNPVVTSQQVEAADTGDTDRLDGSGRAGGIGALLTFFAIGCPICNKVVLLAVGAAGATRWFAPVQPWLAGISIVLLVWAVRSRIRAEAACPVNRRQASV